MTDYTTFEHDVLVIGAGTERGHSCPHERRFDAKNCLRENDFPARSADTLVRMSVASTRKIACGKTIFAGGTGDADRSVRAPSND